MGVQDIKLSGFRHLTHSACDEEIDQIVEFLQTVLPEKDSASVGVSGPTSS